MGEDQEKPAKDPESLPYEHFQSRADTDHYSEIPDYGILHLDIKEAAKWITVDMWYSGYIEDVPELEDFDGIEFDPQLVTALAAQIAQNETRLTSAIENGTLKASKIGRSLDEVLIPEETYVSYDNLYDWLLERGYRCGEVFNGWADTEIEISLQLCDEVAYLREVSKTGKDKLRDISLQRSLAPYGHLDESDQAAVLIAYKSILVEYQSLTNELERAHPLTVRKADRPLPTRARRTLLTIVAALCDRAEINHQERGASQRIKEMTEELGAPVDDGTIKKLLAEIPEAVESRMK